MTTKLIVSSTSTRDDDKAGKLLRSSHRLSRRRRGLPAPLLLPGLLACVLLGSCESAPKPPTIDESRKRPANAQMAVDLQTCRSDLQNTRLAVNDANRQVEASVALARLLAWQVRQPTSVRSTACNSPPPAPADSAAPAAVAEPASAPQLAASAAAIEPATPGSVPLGMSEHAAVALAPTQVAEQAASASPGNAPATARTTAGNGIYTLRFEFGSIKLNLPPDLAAALIDEARSAPLVLLRGRTDGSIDSPGDSRIARERAQAVRDYLIAAGVPRHRIRTTWQPSGDHEADNSSPTGRDINRRVEIEIYRALPIAMNPALARRL